MSSVLCENQSTSFTDSDLTAEYAAGGQSGLLAAANLGTAVREDSGLLTPAAVQAAAKSLMTAGLIPVPPQLGPMPGNQGSQMSPKDQTMGNEQERIEAFMRKDKAFLEHVKREYCFYDARYKYALRQLIGKLQAGYSETNSENQALIKKYLQASQTLNQKLNDLAQLTNVITQMRLQQTQDQNSAINSLNVQLTQRSKLLQKQNKILATEQGAANLYKDMTRYTKEKVDSTNNLLTMYSFLNFTALGLIFYLYSAMKE
jgi:hypothetical protein